MGQRIPNILTDINQDIRDDAHNAIANLQYEHLFRGSGTLVISSLVRIDMQGTFIRNNVNYSNIQVQVNGRQNPSTIAHILFSHQAANITDFNNQRGAINAAIRALEQSLDSRNTFIVTGTLP